MENNLKRIYVVLATYNRGEKCIEVIKQIINQNISNWDLAVIDDGSDENHSNHITDYLSQNPDSRISYHKNLINKKLPLTLNRGIDLFWKGSWEYFTWVSDDNYYSPNYLNNLFSLNANFAHSSWNIGEKQVQTEYKTFHQIKNNFYGLGSYMWNRETMKKIGKFNPKYTLVCDLEFLFKTYYFTENNIKYSQKSEMVYIVHDGADSVTKTEEMRRQHGDLNANFCKDIIL